MFASAMLLSSPNARSPLDASDVLERFSALDHNGDATDVTAIATSDPVPTNAPDPVRMLQPSSP